MTSDLQSIVVLVTRPHDAGNAICADIVAAGGRAMHFPVIAFAPPADEAAFHTAIKAVGHQDWVIYNSPQAVAAAIPAIRAAWPSLAESVRFAAVGAGTAKALNAAGYAGVLYPKDEWSSEGLLALPEFQAVSGQHIMVVRGEGGRQFLEKIFNERDAVVQSCEAYQRVLPDCDPAACRQALNDQSLQVIVAGSYESVNNLKLLLGEDIWPILRKTPLIVMSERVEKLATELGFQTVWATKNASRQAVLALISEKKEALCQKIK